MWSLADEPALRAARGGDAPLPPAEVYENQRFYGFGWQAPGPLERPAWSDADGEPVPLLAPPTEGAGWAVAADDDADADGWSYASVFHHVGYTRRGGRASQRMGDFVRRRRWVWVGDGETREGGSVRPPLALPSARPDAAARKAAETARRAAALRAFVALLASTARRLRLWNMLPLDPTALVVLAPRHAARLAADAKLFAGARVDLSGGGDSGGGVEAAGATAGAPAPPAARVRAADLVTAALHARAAYGYAAAAGHLASLSSYALMHTVRAVEFDAAGGASAAANSDAACDLAGVPRGALLMAEWASSVSRPCHYVAADEAGQRIVISVRGSLQAGDMLSNLSARPMEVTLGGVSGRVHEGMMAAATYVHCSTAPALAAAAAAYPGWPVLCVGHSMGGGVATILTALLRDDGGVPGLGDVTCIAVGPAAVFSEPLAAALAPAVTSVVLGADAVPRLSLASVEAALAELAAASPVRVAAAELRRAVGSAAAGAAEALAAAGAELRDIVSSVGGALGTGTASTGGGAAASPPAGLSSLPRIAASDDGGVAAAAAAAMVRAAANEVELIDLSPRELAGEAGGDATDASTPDPTTTMPPSPADAAAMAARSRALLADGGGRAADVSPAAAAAATAAAAAADAAVLATASSSPPPPPSAEFDAAALEADRVEPLLVAGTLLWVLPPGDLAAAAGGAAAADAAAAAAAAAARAPVAPDDGDLDAVAAAAGPSIPGRVRRSAAATAAPAAAAAPPPPPPSGALVLAAPRAAFGRILLTPDAVQDHLPDSYVAALERL